MTDKGNGDEKIALMDMDGTLCDFHNALERDMQNVMGGLAISPQIKEKVEALIKSQPGWYRNLKPLAVGFAIYDMLRDIGFRIAICSKGSRVSKNSWTEKMEWVAEHLDDDVLVNLTLDKGLVYGRVMVDDYPAHFQRWLEHRPRGLVIVPDQPWNREITTGGQMIKVYTVDDVKDARPALEEAFSR